MGKDVDQASDVPQCCVPNGRGSQSKPQLQGEEAEVPVKDILSQQQNEP